MLQVLTAGIVRRELLQVRVGEPLGGRMNGGGDPATGERSMSAPPQRVSIDPSRPRVNVSEKDESTAVDSYDRDFPERKVRRPSRSEVTVR